MQTNNKKLEPEFLRKFGITTGIIFALLFGLLLPWLFGHGYPKWPWIICAVLCVWGLLSPKTLEPVYFAWMKLGNILGWINSRIILGFVFFTLFFVFGMFMKLLGKDPMARKLDADMKSYRVNCQPYNKNHIERPF